MRSPRAAWLGVAVLVVAGAATAWWLLPSPPPARLVLHMATFDDLVGWSADDRGAAIVAFRRSCDRLARRDPAASLGGGGIAGRIGDWRPVCAAAALVAAHEEGAARRFFEHHFVPLEARNNRTAEGLFTGYYEPELRGSRRPGGRYTTPIYRRPGELVTVDLGLFRDTWRGQRIAGRRVGGHLEPFATRAEIERGALAGRGLEVVWVDDAIDAFFLHVQGSGRVVLDDGAVIRLGYAGHNGHAYFAIGRELVARGALEVDAVSMQSIRAWLEANPEQAKAVMGKNASYVFFRRFEGDGPAGAQGAVLTPGRSLAVDRTFIPLGVPLWLDISEPRAPGSEPVPLRRLVIAQDTGGAIRGPVRGDLFWGAGATAAERAGRMRARGRYWLLVPRQVVRRSDPWRAPGAAP